MASEVATRTTSWTAPVGERLRAALVVKDMDAGGGRHAPLMVGVEDSAGRPFCGSLTGGGAMLIRPGPADDGVRRPPVGR
jgi:hypothetical protein